MPSSLEFLTKTEVVQTLSRQLGITKSEAIGEYRQGRWRRQQATEIQAQFVYRDFSDRPLAFVPCGEEFLSVSKEKAAEIASDSMPTFITNRSAHSKRKSYGHSPFHFGLICFSDTVKGPIRNMFFVVLLPDGTIVGTKSREAAVDIIATPTNIDYRSFRKAVHVLSEILDPKILVSNKHRVPRIDYRHVEGTLVFAFE